MRLSIYPHIVVKPTRDCSNNNFRKIGFCWWKLFLQRKLKSFIMNSYLQKIAKTIAACTLGIAMLAYVSSNVGDTLNFRSVQAQETSGGGGGCFVRTTSNCPVIGGQNGGQRLTCDNTGTYVPNSSCTPIHCVTGTGTVVWCSSNPAGTGSTGTGTGTGTP